MEGSEGYPFNLPSYHLAFDDGKFCEEELNNPSTSWRSEEYPCNSNVLILDHHQGVGTSQHYDDAGIDELLSARHPSSSLI